MVATTHTKTDGCRAEEDLQRPNGDEQESAEGGRGRGSRKGQTRTVKCILSVQRIVGR